MGKRRLQGDRLPRHFELGAGRNNRSLLGWTTALLCKDPSFDLLACLGALKKPGDSYEHRNELLPDEDFQLTYER